MVVWTHNSGTYHRLRLTASNNEDPGRLAGFTIADSYYSGPDIDDLTIDSSRYALEIMVHGGALKPRPFVGVAYQVTPDWLHMPDGVEVGDQFRLLYVTYGFGGGATDATSDDIDYYNTMARRNAGFHFNDRIIRSVSQDFKAVVCTDTVDARTNTGMTDAEGVPVHWLDGGHDDRPTLIADSYDQFYSADWVNTEWGAYVTGNSTRLTESRQIWTGCDARGVAHPDAYMGNTMAMDDMAPVAAVGRPGSENDNFAPLGAVDITSGYDSAETREYREIYAISPVFTVVPER